MVATPAVFINRSLFVDDYTLANERYQQSQHGQLQKSVDPCPLVSSAKIRFVQFLLIISYLIGISAWKCTSYIFTIRYGREIIETFWMFQFLKISLLDEPFNTTNRPMKLIRQSMGIEMHLLYTFCIEIYKLL